MDLNFYFINQYETYLDTKNKLEDCFRDIQKDLETDRSKENLDESDKFKENLDESEKMETSKENLDETDKFKENLDESEKMETSKENLDESEKKETSKENLDESEKMETSVKKNGITEKEKIINFIYKKMSLFLHPDKNKKYENEFIKLKKCYEEKDFSKIYYFMLKLEEYKIKKKVFELVEKKYKLEEVLVEEINKITTRINNMVNNELWKAYYHPDEKLREITKNKILNLIR